MILPLYCLFILQSNSIEYPLNKPHPLLRFDPKKGVQLPPDSNGNFINSGSPSDVDPIFDCKLRQYAYEYGQQIQPRQGNFIELFDALQLTTACNQTRPKPIKRKIPNYNINNYDNNCVYYVDPINGNDNNNGLTNITAFITIEKAIQATRNTRVNNEICTINLMSGTFYLKNPISLDSQDSYLTIQNYAKSEVTISGGLEIDFGNNEWELESYSDVQWIQYNNANNVWGRAESNKSNDLIRYLGKYNTLNECSTAIKNANSLNNGPKYYSYTWHSINYTDADFAGQCFGVRDISWQPYKENDIMSGRLIGQNIWKRKVVNFNEFGNKIHGLRVNNMRGIRARYPDQDPENSMQFDPLSGYIPYNTKWYPPTDYPDAINVIVNASNYPSNILWPMIPQGTGNTWTGEGDWGDFYIGLGGPCGTTNTVGGVDPPFGYWCSSTAPRKITRHECPTGLSLDISFGLNLPYNNFTECFIHSWRPSHWFTFMWSASKYDYNPSTNELTFNKGGFQGGEGVSTGAEWYIENIFEELSLPNEYYYSSENNYLYYFNNQTNEKLPPNNNTLFVATNNNVLFNISGNQEKPVNNLTIQGLVLRDTRFTYLDSHGLPSGGDWALQRQGAITVEGSNGLLINEVLFTRLDGIGISINGFNRYITVQYCDFEYLGESAMAAWGYTSGLEDTLPGFGPDGRDGNQPRFTYIKNNLVREIGIWQKQSSMWFQAQTCQTKLENNIFFNGPRAAINFNDGFGGDNEIYGNLLLNTCRESGDHGPYNQWDRVPYITRVRNGSDSIIPANNKIYNNFMIGNYQTQENIDTDDGSSFLEAHDNFLVYGYAAIKSDFGGHDNYHYNNVNAYMWSWYLQCCNAGANNQFWGNSVISNNENVYTSNCDLPVGSDDFQIYNNSIYITNPDALQVCKMSFDEWQKKGNDPGTTINNIPTYDDIINMGKEKLKNNKP